jgi:PhnB protein
MGVDPADSDVGDGWRKIGGRLAMDHEHRASGPPRWGSTVVRDRQTRTPLGSRGRSWDRCASPRAYGGGPPDASRPLRDGPYDCCVPLTAHIVVQGADEAATFYHAAFGAEVISRIPTPDGRLMSVQLRIADSVLHLADEFPEMGVLAPPSIGGTAVVLSLEVSDAEAAFAKAIEAGAAVRQPLQEMFWGDLHGQLDDPFGHRWNISQHIRDVPHDEVVAGAAKLFA